MHAVGPPLRQRDHARVVVGSEGRVERGADRRQGERVAREGAADSADVGLVGAERAGELGRERGRHPERRGRHPARDRLADDEEVGFEAPRARAARADADRVGLVDHEEGAGAAGDLAERVVEAGVGRDDADVGERGLREHAGDVAGRERGLERVDVVELDDLGGDRRVDRRSDVAGPRLHPTVIEDPERLVDGAVVAPVEDEDLVAPGRVPREPQHEPVGVGRRHRDLPERQAETLPQLLADGDRVFGGEHGRDPASRLPRDGVDGRRRRVTGHRAGVAEAEVDVGVTVDVDEVSVVRLLDEDRHAARPSLHPVHRHTADEGCLGPLEQRQ